MSDTNNTTISTAASPSKDEAMILQNASEPSSPNTTTATAAATATPPSASPSPSITEENNTKLLQSHELLQALATQMQYYFSPHNLSKDTYLSTIMKLNSGFVPITILCGFTNINRIIARYANALANGMDIADIDVHHLLVCSAVEAKVLKIILLDQDGNMIKTHGEEGYDDMKGPKAFEAIGTDDEGEGIDADADADGEGVSHAETAVVKEKDRADANVDAKSSSTNSTVILRDVPEEATEDDIRHVFEGDDGNVIIHNVQKEVGHCWFVTIDASTSPQDLVSILLGLRSKTICNEPIKARLKTQSTATQGTPMQGPGYNPHRTRQTYTGDRISYSKKFNNNTTGTKPYSKPRVGKVGDYPSSGPYKGNNYDASKNNVKPVEKAGPPPPLVEEHFPGLAAGSLKSVSASADASTDASTSASGESEAVGVPVAVKKEIVHASGYAAALKKAAPPVMEVSTENVKRTKPKSPARSKKVVDAKSTGTVSTEGSIADDKSHASKETDVASFPAVKSWGGGRSFADILKTQEA